MRFSFYISKDGIGIRVHDKSVKKFMDRVRQILSRSNGLSTEQKAWKAQALGYWLGELFWIGRYEEPGPEAG